MQLANTTARYGGVTKFLHWLVFFAFVFQYIVANIMIRITQSQTALGFSQGTLYNWHKSIGLLILATVAVRYVWRKLSPLPDWAETLTKRERNWVHWIERILYICMFLMPISGYFFVMAGGYGVLFFGLYPLPNPIGKVEWLANIAQIIHRTTSYIILITLAAHIGLVLKHQFVNKDRLLNRMLPSARQ